MPPPPVPVKKVAAASVPTPSTSASSSKPTPAAPSKGAILGLGGYDDDSDEEGGAEEPPAKRPHTSAPNGVAKRQVDGVVIAGAGADPIALQKAQSSTSIGSSQALVEVEEP